MVNYDTVQLRTVEKTVPDGWVKLNMDGSWLSQGSAGAGMVLRDSTGDINYILLVQRTLLLQRCYIWRLSCALACRAFH